jgi:nucleotide-binding universal stress UspA family protein
MTGAKSDLGIVVGVDESSGANTVRWAAHEAALRKIPLTLVRVGLMPASGPSARVWTTAPTLNELREQHADEAQQILSKAIKIVEDSADSGDLPAINSKLLYSARVPTLVDLSKKAQMVVVGRRLHAASSGSLSDSVAAGLVHLAHCPVAVIHDEDSGSLPSPHLPVLVGIDGSGGSQLGTEIAFGEASLRRVELVALHAWSDGDTSTMPTVEWPAVQSRAHQVLADGLAGWQDCYPDVTVQRIVVHNDPARHLLEKSCSAQLLVVGSHGRGGSPGMLLGSVTTAVIEAADNPVIVAR